MEAIGVVVDKLKDFNDHLLTNLQSTAGQKEGDAGNSIDDTPEETARKQNLWKKIKQKVVDKWNDVKGWWGAQ